MGTSPLLRAAGPATVALVIAWAVGCAPPSREARSARRVLSDERISSEARRCAVCDGDDRDVLDVASEDHLGAPSRSFAAQSTTRVIAPVEPRAARPGKRHLVNIDIKGARTSDALQFLADAGGFNLVMSGDLAGPVTLVLHQVDAFDALVAVAETQHLGVEYEGHMVKVGAIDASPAGR